MMDNFMTFRVATEGIFTIISGWGFLKFNILGALGNEEIFEASKYAKFIIFVSIGFFGLGALYLFLDGNLNEGLIYIIAGFSLLILRLAWNDCSIFFYYVATFLVFASISSISVFLIIKIGISTANISLLLFAIGMTIFQIAGYTDKDTFIGGIILYCASEILGGIFMIKGFTRVFAVIFSYLDLAFNFIPNQDKVKAISLIVSGIGVLGILLGLLIGTKEYNIEKIIIGGISYIIIGVGFIGLSAVDILYSKDIQESVMFTVFTIGLICEVICGVNLIFIGGGLLFNKKKLFMNNFAGAIFGFVGLFIQWFIDGNYLFGIGSILFVVTMIIALIPDLKVRLIILIGYPLFVLSSLFFAGALIYSGIKILI